MTATYGRFAYGDWFNPSSTNYQGPLPRTPRTAGTECYCPSCESQGWFDTSPLCRLWNAHCELCGGTRSWFDYSTRTRQRCDLCEELWAEDVREFRNTIGSAAHRARVQAYYDGVRTR
jgi:hypothetical protein